MSNFITNNDRLEEINRQILEQLKILNLHQEEITGEGITVKDIND